MASTMAINFWGKLNPVDIDSEFAHISYVRFVDVSCSLEHPLLHSILMFKWALGYDTTFYSILH